MIVGKGFWPLPNWKNSQECSLICGFMPTNQLYICSDDGTCHPQIFFGFMAAPSIFLLILAGG